jgi:hypothetical protein
VRMGRYGIDSGSCPVVDFSAGQFEPLGSVIAMLLPYFVLNNYVFIHVSLITSNCCLKNRRF